MYVCVIVNFSCGFMPAQMWYSEIYLSHRPSLIFSTVWFWSDISELNRIHPWDVGGMDDVVLSPASDSNFELLLLGVANRRVLRDVTVPDDVAFSNRVSYTTRRPLVPFYLLVLSSIYQLISDLSTTIN